MPVAELSQDRPTTGWRDAATATRLTSLDSIRGLAALSVVICHYLIFLQFTAVGLAVWHWLWIPPLSLLSTAYGPVILFFVLSGYVLALSLIGEANPGWLGFAIRRFFRIWPAYAITIAASFVIVYLRGAPEPVGALISQLAMTTSHISLDMPGWSLVYELRVSLVFPVLLICVRRAPTITLLISFGLHLAGLYGPYWLAGFIPDTATYVIYFSTGAWLALNRARVAEIMQVPPLAKALVCVIGLVCLSVPDTITYAATDAGVGACLIIACVTTSSQMGRAMSARWCEFLGRVSYSLYLTHVVILLTMVKVLTPFLRVEWILVIAVPVIGAAAVAGYYWVEKPSMKLGRAVAIRISARAAGLQHLSGAKRVSPAAPEIGDERYLPIPQGMNLLDSTQVSR